MASNCGSIRQNEVIFLEGFEFILFIAEKYIKYMKKMGFKTSS